jgi:hypothetical protein
VKGQTRMEAIAMVIALAVALGLPGLLGFLCIVWLVHSVISAAVESGVRRGRSDRDFRSY